jgi:hypothetical protein
MEERVKNLGQVAAMVSSTTEPSNKKVLWYDETVTIGCPIKYYNLTTNSWELLAS